MPSLFLCGKFTLGDFVGKSLHLLGNMVYYKHVCYLEITNMGADYAKSGTCGRNDSSGDF